MMDLAAARTAIAAAAPAGVRGYPRPPGHVVMPCLIVGDPTSIEYHQAAARRHEAVFPVRVVVPRSAEQASTVELDTLISYPQIPAGLEAATPTAWAQLVVQSSAGGYADFSQDGTIVGLSADLFVTVVFT